MITYHSNYPVDVLDLTTLYNSVLWTAYTDYPDKMAQLLPGSLWYLAALDDEKLVGMLRVVGDDCSIVYIQDICVDPAYQRQGIGTELVRRALDRYSHIRQTVLVTDNDPATKAFYQSVGMSPIEETGGVCFVRYRLDV
ncbi:MAG TPA: GNAT family N-acetyltransferase [Tissierellia bacterium]|nr:GNAT family N-acetyltransferase [Tissierellia bacterium]